MVPSLYLILVVVIIFLTAMRCLARGDHHHHHSHHHHCHQLLANNQQVVFKLTYLNRRQITQQSHLTFKTNKTTPKIINHQSWTSSSSLQLFSWRLLQFSPWQPLLLLIPNNVVSTRCSAPAELPVRSTVRRRMSKRVSWKMASMCPVCTSARSAALVSTVLCVTWNEETPASSGHFALPLKNGFYF